MTDSINTYSLQEAAMPLEQDDRKTMVKVDHVSMVFNKASEQLNNLKEYAIALARHELRFKEFRALDDITLDIKEGDVFGILGTNGSGKSTLLKIIAGVLDPSEGSCTVEGKIAPLIELGAGFDMDLTARENIFLNGALLGYSKKFIEKHFDEIVEFAEVEDFLDMPLKNYSSGMIARIAFAIATVIVPDILIVDEVLAVGDFMFQKKCEDRIASLINEHNVTVLIVSHNNEQIERLCNKAAWIEKGHMRMLSTASEVCNTYRVLGGHTGSRESEKIVFNVLVDPIKANEKLVSSIEADNRYGMAAKFMRRCFESPKTSLVLAPGDREIDCLIAQGFASSLQSPILLFQEEHLPDSTIQEIERLAPSRIFVMCSGDNCDAITDIISRNIRDVIGWTPAIEVIKGETPTELSANVLEAGKQYGSWGDHAIISYDFCIGDLIAFSPLSYREKYPILVQPADQPHNTEPLLHLLRQNNISHAYFIEDEVGISNQTIERLEQEGIKARHFWSDGVYHANSEINQWIESTALSPEYQIQGLFVASSAGFTDALVAGAYAAKMNSLILLESPQDLDSVAHTIKYVEKKQGEIAHITFIGNRTRFSNTDKTLLSKVITRSHVGKAPKQ